MHPISRETAEHYIWGEQSDGWHLLKTPMLSVIQERVPAGVGEVKHYHEKAHQFFFVLSGIATMEIDNDTFTIPSQHGISVSPKTAHKLTNASNEDLHFLVISSPPSHGDRVTLE